MARLDAFLFQLIAHEADSLAIETGDNLYLTRGTQRVPLLQVKPGTITNAHIVGLVMDSAPAAVKSQLEAGTATSWDYVLGNRLFRIEMSVAGERLRVCVRDVPDQTQSVTTPASLSAADDDDLIDPGSPAIERFFHAMAARRASDLHLTSGRAPMIRVDGDVLALPSSEPLEPYALQRMIEEIMPERNAKEFASSHDTDFCYDSGHGRLRCNIFQDRTGVGGVFRMIPPVSSAEALGVPPTVLEMCALKKGLILVTGASRSGTSTTLGALVDCINSGRTGHIITVEAPVEIVHEPKRCLVNQREVGEHTDSVARALRAAAREDPDVVVVGDLRDAEALQLAIEMADGGLLVLAAMHAQSAAAAVGRLLELVPPASGATLHPMLARCLKSVVAQTLCKARRGGRIAAYEVLPVTDDVRALIRDGKPAALEGAALEGAGGRTQADALAELVLLGDISQDEALACAADPNTLRERLDAAELLRVA